MTEHSEHLLFSVVIACYNYGRFLSRAIDSIFAQTYSNFEIIVVDDGSTDETPQVAARYGEKITYHRQKNSGQSSAYNKGADLATGDYVYILDADDELVPAGLEIFAQAIRKNPEVDAIFAGYTSISSSGKRTVNFGSTLPNSRYARLHEFLSRKLVGIQNGAAVVKRNLFANIRFPESLRNNTDIVFFGLVLANYSVAGIGTPLLISHEHPARVRKNLSIILQTGMSPVDRLFDKKLMPSEMMFLRKVYTRQRALSIARILYINRDYRNALHYYHIALKSSPLSLFRAQVFKRYLISLLKSQSSGQA